MLFMNHLEDTLNSQCPIEEWNGILDKSPAYLPPYTPHDRTLYDETPKWHKFCINH